MGEIGRRFWLEKALENLKKMKANSGYNEKETQRLLIEPLLAWAGYDVWDWDPQQIRENYPVQGVKNEEYPDYGLLNNGKLYMLLEAKALGKHLEEYSEKLTAYCRLAKINLGLITDGEHWILLDDRLDSEEKKILSFKIDEKMEEKKGYDALPLFHPSKGKSLESLIKNIKTVCKTKDESLRKKMVKTVISDALEKIGMPAAETEKPKEEKKEPLQKEFATNARFFVVPVADEESESAVDCVKRLLGKNIFAIRAKRHLKPGDWLVFYAAKVGFVARASVKRLLEEHPLFEGHNLKTILELHDVEIFANTPIYPDDDLRQKLEAFKNKRPIAFKYWMWFVQGTQKITRADFELLTDW